MIPDLPVKNISTIKTKPPTQYFIKVPFTSQAPFGNWKAPFDESCEEASLLIVEFYLQKREFTPQIANQEIIKMTDWEKNNGFSMDITLQELGEIAKEYFRRDYEIFYDNQVNVEQIKKNIIEDHPVIIPAAGQLLGNPFYKGEGPPYHMLVITGYDENYFYTNDPGTKRGENFKYTQKTILNAIHDWTGDKKTIKQGGKKMMIVY